MKKVLLLGLMTVCISTYSFAQKAEMGRNASWFKIGLEASAPVGAISNYTSFAAGATLSGQYMATRNFGIGLTSGYTQFFGKNGADGFGNIPVGLMLRYYSQPAGFFAGVDAGYSFLTGDNTPTGGVYVKPQLGYHNYSWNFYAFYNQVFVSDANFEDIQNIGIGASYNLGRRKK
jgi:hypothetical protein